MEKVVVALCGCEGVGLCVAERSVRWWGRWESKPYFGEEGLALVGQEFGEIYGRRISNGRTS
jgi:hypothetical protein